MHKDLYKTQNGTNLIETVKLSYSYLSRATANKHDQHATVNGTAMRIW